MTIVLVDELLQHSVFSDLVKKRDDLVIERVIDTCCHGPGHRFWFANVESHGQFRKKSLFQFYFSRVGNRVINELRPDKFQQFINIQF